MTTLVLEFKKTENDDETRKETFIQTQKQKQLLMKVVLMIHFNQ